MSWVGKTFSSSVGRKFLVGLTGFLLIGFLVIHLIGNLTIYVEAGHGAHTVPGINVWATILHTLAEGLLPLLPLMEVGLIGLFVVHIGMVLKLTLDNKAARPVPYKVHSTKSKNALENNASKFMLISGIVVGVFLVVHLLDVFTVYKGEEENLHAVLVENLSGWKAIVYLAGTLFVGVHIFHGFQSALRSFGINNDKYTPALTTFGKVFGIVMGLAFASIPLLIVAGVVQ